MTRHKITMIGAGSSIFMRNLMTDLLQGTDLGPLKIVLQDIDESRLKQSRDILSRIISLLNTTHTINVEVESTTNQRVAIDGADFVILCFQIGGYKPSTVIDFEIPKKYGLEQTIGDTLGIGGIMRGLRTVPHLLSICKDIIETAPTATLLNHVNPMCINTWAMYELAPKVSQVGLCHSVPLTSKLLAEEIGLDIKDLRFLSAGINHMSFFLTLEQRLADGRYKSIYPKLFEQYANGTSPSLKDMPRCENKVRFEIMKHFGYFVTESSEHFSEYVPWFIKRGRDDIIRDFKIPIDEYLARCEEQIKDWQHSSTQNIQKLEEINEVHDNEEYTIKIIRAMITNKPDIVYANVRNDDLITNLPNSCCVEVPCLVDANGVQPTHIGKIPVQLSAMMKTNINVQELVVEAVKHENKQLVYHAAMLDPHTAAELDLRQITSLVDDLIIAHGDMLPAWLK